MRGNDGGAEIFATPQSTQAFVKVPKLTGGDTSAKK